MASHMHNRVLFLLHNCGRCSYVVVGADEDKQNDFASVTDNLCR